MRKPTDPVSVAASQIRQLMPLFDTHGKSEAQLRAMAREYDIQIDSDSSQLAVSVALSDAADSRIRTLIEDAAKGLGTTFEDAQERVNKALGY